MEFKRRHEWRREARPVDAENLVETVVGQAGFDCSGTIETLEAEVRTLTEIVSRLAAKLPPGDLADLADRYGYELCTNPRPRA
jgi:hypothetical protein